MKKVYLSIALLLMSGCATLQSPKETSIAVSKLLDEVQIALEEIDSKTTGSSLPPFVKAEIILSTKAGLTKTGEASAFVAAKGEKATSRTNTITLVLGPNTSKQKKKIKTPGQELAKYVIAAIEAVDKKNFLELKKLVVEAGFNVVTTKSGGIKIEVINISLGGQVSDSTSDGHILKLTFGKE